MAMSRMEIVDSEESKNFAIVHKTNQGYSGKDLYKLKSERPDLFAGSQAVASAPKPTKAMCRDPENGELCEVNVGADLSKTLCLRGDASSSAGANGATNKHVVINDLRRAGEAMKLDLSHHDFPAAMFAVFDSKVNGAAVTDAATRGLHMQLLRRLASFRGRWHNSRLETMVADSLTALAQEVGASQGIAVALALVLGGRVVLGASHGTKCMIFCGASGDDSSIDNVEVVSDGPAPSTHCVVLDDGHLGALLLVEGFKAAGFSTTRLRNVARPHMSGERPRAAAITLLKSAREAGAAGPLSLAAISFGWSDTAADGPAAKRFKSAPSAGVPKVRCRHLLLRHVGCQAAVGARRAKPPTRSLAEAEQQLLDVLIELAWGGRDLPAAFTAKCKELSECDTALRGGDLAGDLGWLDRDPKKNKKVPAAVVRVAFTLAVGQLSDIIASEQGVHLAIRIA